MNDGINLSNINCNNTRSYNEYYSRYDYHRADTYYKINASENNNNFDTYNQYNGDDLFLSEIVRRNSPEEERNNSNDYKSKDIKMNMNIDQNNTIDQTPNVVLIGKNSFDSFDRQSELLFSINENYNNIPKQLYVTNKNIKNNNKYSKIKDKKNSYNSINTLIKKNYKETGNNDFYPAKNNIIKIKLEKSPKNDRNLQNLSNTPPAQNGAPNSRLGKKRGPYKKKIKPIEEVNFSDKCFPFKTGKGIINMTSKKSYEIIEPFLQKSNLFTTESSGLKLSTRDEKIGEEIPNMKDSNEFLNNLYLMKFKTQKYTLDEKGKKIREKKARKFRSDNIRKKIKVKLFHTLMSIINTNLKKVGSNMFFVRLPQIFTHNYFRKINHDCLELTFKELIEKNFTKDIKLPKGYKTLKFDEMNYDRNQKTLEYLEQNKEISNISGFEIIKNMKYIDLLEKYFISKEFEDSLITLREKENQGQEYIQLFIYKAKNYISYYKMDPDDKDKAEIENEEENFDEDDLENDEDSINFLNSQNINEYFNF
jgi:hypothetical protein